MQHKPKGVRATHREYDTFLPIWQRCGDVVDGQRSMHKGGEKYLPKLKAEGVDDYKARIARSDFFNATWRTIDGLVGMAFRKDPTVTVPAKVEPYLADIDMAGTHVHRLAKDLCEDVLEYGRIGVLVDFPAMPENVTAISEQTGERMGLRPRICTYEAAAITNWRYQTIGGATVLVQGVLKETAEIEVDEFTRETEDRWRVLDLEGGRYRQRIYRIDKNGNDELVEEIYPVRNGATLSFIPFYIVGRNGLQTSCEEPPLIDLVDANIAHYQVNSDYRHGLHFTGLPTLFLAGVTQEEGAAPFYIGSAAAITSPHPDAKGMFIEYTGQGLGAVEKALASLERRLAVLGARMIADENRQVETLGATQIKRAGENSVMAAIVLAISEVMEKCIAVMADWVGASGEVVYQINRDFVPADMDAQRLTALVGAWQSGAISEAELFDVLKRADVIDAEKTLEEHQEEVGQMTLPAPEAIAA